MAAVDKVRAKKRWATEACVMERASERTVSRMASNSR